LAENDKDLDDIPDEIRSQMEFHLVNTMDEVIKIALESPRLPGTSIEPEGKPAEGGIVAN
jgi:ATP-dependent Lon protease